MIGMRWFSKGFSGVSRREDGGSMSEDWRESTRLDWNDESELPVSLLVKSRMLAWRGRRQGSGLPALVLRARVSPYILERFDIARWSPS